MLKIKVLGLDLAKRVTRELDTRQGKARELDTHYPAAMAMLIFVLRCAAMLASMWVTGTICARTAYLVRSNFESARTRPPQRRRRG